MIHEHSHLVYNISLEDIYMNLLDAMKHSGDNWFRPVGMKGSAFMVKGDRTLLVPNDRGGVLYMTPHAHKLLGEWEIVNPIDVCAEE